MKYIKNILLAGVISLFSFTAFSQVNINTASVKELTTLPGIGPTKAKAIIEYREKNGEFKSIKDLEAVSGISKKTIEKVEELVDTKNQ